MVTICKDLCLPRARLPLTRPPQATSLGHLSLRLGVPLLRVHPPPPPCPHPPNFSTCQTHTWYKIERYGPGGILHPLGLLTVSTSPMKLLQKTNTIRPPFRVKLCGKCPRCAVVLRGLGGHTCAGVIGRVQSMEQL